MVNFIELFSSHPNMMRREFMAFIPLEEVRKLLVLNKRINKILHPADDMNDGMYMYKLYDLVIRADGTNILKQMFLSSVKNTLSLA